LKRDVSNLYAELKYKTEQLHQLDSELERTRAALQDVERSIVR
jgi:5-bromo-4-chloroindolyl phosphate hydrolysis protein